MMASAVRDHPATAPPDSFDDFRLVRLLGRGAMGEVWLGHDRRLDRPVAVKFIRGHIGDEQRARFLTEARAIARLSHPNVVTIFRAGEIQRRPYLVSELVVGTSLAELARPVDPARLSAIALGLTRGLAAAHRRGVLHRDIKPANAILADSGEVKLLDFGVAKLLDPRNVDGGWRPDEPGPSAPSLAEAPAHLGVDADATRSVAPTAHLGVDAARSIAPADHLGVDADATRSIAPDDHATRAARHADTTRDAPNRALAPGLVDDAGPIATAGAVGTPRYMAPELWGGAPADRRSDIYSLGMLLYELAAGRVPDAGVAAAELPELRTSTDLPPLVRAATGVDGELAAIIDRCVARDPSRRFGSADELRDALEALTSRHAPRRPLPAGNPYRGLQRFDAHHRALFFGRDRDVALVVERLTTEPVVVVAGDSGVGKSSLCRAGVLPDFGDAGWAIARLSPGRDPLAALAAALAPYVEIADDDQRSPDHSPSPERWLVARMLADPGYLARALRHDRARRIVVFIDQLEEICSQAGDDAAAATAEILGALAVPSANVRLLATVRSDFLGRVAALPGLGAELAPMLCLIRALGRDGLRDAVVEPARASGFRFESEAMIDSLTEGAARARGGLPLLSFALAELWEARDADARTIPATALARVGGVSGALARHADAVMAALPPAERSAARAVLLRLVTPAGTRDRRPRAELVADDDPAASAGFEALVRGRLLEIAAGDDGDRADSWQIAHEALVDGWDTLRGWIARTAERRGAMERLERAAGEWQRLGRRDDELWTSRQLADSAVSAADDLGPRERAFLVASERAARHRRWRRAGAAAVIPLVVAAGYTATRWSERRALDRRVEAQLTVARTELRSARAHDKSTEAARRTAFASFDHRDRAGGEQAWDAARRASAEAERRYAAASRALDGALELDRSRGDLRTLQCDTLYERALLAERDVQAERAADLIDRLAGCDDGGERRTRWRAPAELRVKTTPPAATLTVERYLATDRKRVATPHRGPMTAPATLQLEPGSYVVVASAPGHASVRVPLVVGRGERRDELVELPPDSTVPPGFVYVPAGRFLYGSADADEQLRRAYFNTVPQHQVETPAYFIARHEVTFAEWILWMETLSPSERARRRPRAGVISDVAGDNFGLTQLGDRWQFTLRRGDHVYQALDGELLRYRQRDRRVIQDWRRFPVSGVSYDDAERYAAWLSASGRVPGARLCNDHEWERAARGADDRRFPAGDHLDADDANFDETYGRRPLAFGPDEVGSHPASRSPFGVDDLAGNVWEWVRSVEVDGQPLERGGAWYFGQFVARAMNREIGEPEQRDPLIGLRMCATPPR